MITSDNTKHLCGYDPLVSSEELIERLVPPRHFAFSRFHTYIPDDQYPSQRSAVDALNDFLSVAERPRQRKKWWKKFSGISDGSQGIYLDGGHGVGKTHLLVSLWHAASVAKSYGTFVEYTNLVGALGFQQAVEYLCRFRLLCIDEFELDDPADTVLMSSLLAKLVESGSRLAVTSNTLPDRLGEKRFAATDFTREIQNLSSFFTVVTIRGNDYRQTHTEVVSEHSDHSRTEVDISKLTKQESFALYKQLHLPNATIDSFDDVCNSLKAIHPSRYFALVKDVRTVFLYDCFSLTDQSVALRFVVFIDRLYDDDIALYMSGVSYQHIFADDLLRGGYRKKYLRALSRMQVLSQGS